MTDEKGKMHYVYFILVNVGNFQYFTFKLWFVLMSMLLFKIWLMLYKKIHNMKNILITFFVFQISTSFINAQISIRMEDDINYRSTVEVYDSLSNFNLNYDIIAKEYHSESVAIKNISSQFKQFEGQSIYILPMTKKEHSFNKKWSSNSSKNDKLRGSYYTIDGFDFKIDEKYTGLFKLDKVIFKLKNEDGKKYKWEVAYYSLNDALLVGYYEKLKSKSIGNTFVYTGRSKGKGSQFIVEPLLDHSSIDIKTNQVVDLQNGEEWLCTDIQLVDDEITMQLYAILTNLNGKEIKARIENRFLTKGEQNATFFSCFMEKKEYIGWKDSLIEKYGVDNALLIIGKKAKIGMSDSMCLDSWGEPDSKNRTILNGMEREQWIYKNKSYLYFDNGILVAIQN